MNSLSFIIACIGLLVALGAAGLTFWNLRRAKNDAVRLIRANGALRHELEQVQAENEEFRQQNKRLYKVTMPSFGEPKLKRYNPLDYAAPLVCPTCKETLVAKEDFYEIPVTNEPGTVVAVHLRCEREVKFG